MASEEDESEPPDRKIRLFIEKLIFKEPNGTIIRYFLGIISLASCILFIGLTFEDWSQYDPCCMESKFFQRLDEGFSMAGERDVPSVNIKIQDVCDNTDSGNNAPCTEFFYSRMPKWYEFAEFNIAIIFFVHYILTIAVSLNRF